MPVRSITAIVVLFKKMAAITQCSDEPIRTDRVNNTTIAISSGAFA